jgi:hypothetical protein
MRNYVCMCVCVCVWGGGVSERRGGKERLDDTPDSTERPAAPSPAATGAVQMSQVYFEVRPSWCRDILRGTSLGTAWRRVRAQLDDRAASTPQPSKGFEVFWQGLLLDGNEG